METVSTICVFLVMFGTDQTNAYSKQGIYNHGDNATVLIDKIDKIPNDGRTSFEISFSGFTKKLHDIHMFIIVPNTNNESYIGVSRNYYGRIKDINMNNDSITFILLNVSFMDSGNYTVSEGSLEKGKRSFLVTRRILNGQVSKPMILPFMCINTNTSSIKIGKSHAFDYVDYIIYDVARKRCTYTNHWQPYRDRIDSCVLNDTTFNLILEELTWSDKGAYFAWDDQELLLDALFVGIPAYSIQEIFNHGDNATVLIDKFPTDGRKSFEIYFSGFTNKLRDIHMIIIVPNTNNESYIEVSRNYSGRIKDINMNNDNITFQLLNVSFIDSGNYTVFEGSLEKGKRSILVTRRILTGQVSKPMILSFMCNNTNTSSIKIGQSHTFDYRDYIIYDVARKNCTYTNFSQNLNNRIASCVLNNTNFNLMFTELTWQDKGAYTAWDDQGLLLDSLFVGSPVNNISSPQGTHSPDSSSHEVENGTTLWPLVSSVVVVLVAAVLAIVAVRKIRQNKVSVPKTTINNITDRNGNPTTVDISRNRHFEEATSPEASAMSLTTINNSHDPADFTNNKSHEKVKSNDKHYYARGLNSKSPTTTTSKFQIHSSVSSAEDFQSETTHGYNSTRNCAKLKAECRSDKLHLSSTKSIPGPSFEYDYVVQGTCMTSRARAPDLFVTKQIKGKVMTDDSISWHRKEDKTSSSRDDPSTSITSVNKKGTKKTHCTDPSAEQASRDLNIELPAPRSFKLESAADFRSRGTAQILNYELARDVSDDSSALKREHRENQSCDALHEDLIADSSVRPSRKSSVMTFMDEDCYDSLCSF